MGVGAEKITDACTEGATDQHTAHAPSGDTAEGCSGDPADQRSVLGPGLHAARQLPAATHSAKTTATNFIDELRFPRGNASPTMSNHDDEKQCKSPGLVPREDGLVAECGRNRSEEPASRGRRKRRVAAEVLIPRFLPRGAPGAGSARPRSTELALQCGFPILEVGSGDGTHVSATRQISADDLLRRVAAYCRGARLAESTFGRLAANDGKLLARLRDGGRVTARTLARLDAYMVITRSARLRTEVGSRRGRKAEPHCPSLTPRSGRDAISASSTTGRNISCS
jgi:hypothetical protein